MELRNKIFNQIVNEIENKNVLFDPKIIDDLNENLASHLKRFNNEIAVSNRNKGNVKFLSIVCFLSITLASKYSLSFTKFRITISFLL